ncbi:hypothetical protein KC19_6G132200 [Ceratodon purpureus]|uniref:DUF7032 domain-containing protein n=1 Tax=Ceratodon purpureus TaxID=3225 RepID=A0A8T0HHY6_CERPU|nr:hypothetical protein KC19_6G132200 [Ceratodon purpureus]
MSTRGRGEMGAFQVDVFEESREFTRFKVELAEGKRDSFTGFQFGAVEESRREFTAFQVDVGEERRDLTEFQADTVEERGDFTFLEIPTGEPVGFMKPGVRYDDRTKVEACFQQTLQLMSVAIMDVASVKAFLGRWKVIENRLLQLPALVKEMSHLRSVSNNRVCSELLKGMMVTLQETRSLAIKCTDFSYGGKLQTQSNLDSLCGRLDFHIHDCQLMITGGIMQENPLAICRVTPDSAREAMKWTIQDLLAHLQIGSVDCKHRALDNVLRLMSDDDKNILAIASEGAVTTLVHLLDASQPEIQEKAAAAICLLALNDSCEHAVVAEGGIAPLVRLLDSGSSKAQEQASAALQGLSVSEENARAITSHGGVPALIEICRAGTPAAQAAGAGSLRNLAAVEQLRKGIAEDGAIPIIITVITSGTPMAQENAAATLQNLAVSDDSIRWRIVEDGAVQPLIRYLDCSSQSSAQELALGALRNLAACRDNVDVLCTSGLLPRLAACLRAGPVALQVVAANTVCYIASSAEARRSIGEAGVIGALVKLLDAKSHTLQEYTAQALALLFLVEENQKLFLAEDGGIGGLVLQLETRFNEVGKQYPVAALQALSGHGKCRKEMITSGACFHLRQLADMEVPGARRLLDRLEGGKLRNIITKTLMVSAIFPALHVLKMQSFSNQLLSLLLSFRSVR